MTSRHFWTPAEIDLLHSMYPECHTADVALWVGHTLTATYQRAIGMGLRKSAEYLATDSAGRIQRGRTDPRLIATQFKPGQQSWNKGVKGVTGTHDNCRATQFKAGRAASEARNYVPIGSHRICADGYLERKLTDDPSVYPARRWVAVHRIVWEAAHGPIPAGHIVCFKPGQKTTVLEEVTPERLECITRAENARRNHPASRSPELAKLVQLKGAITRQVNRIAREAQEHTA